MVLIPWGFELQQEFCLTISVNQIVFLKSFHFLSEGKLF